MTIAEETSAQGGCTNACFGDIQPQCDAYAGRVCYFHELADNDYFVWFDPDLRRVRWPAATRRAVPRTRSPAPGARAASRSPRAARRRAARGRRLRRCRGDADGTRRRCCPGGVGAGARGLCVTPATVADNNRRAVRRERGIAPAKRTKTARRGVPRTSDDIPVVLAAGRRYGAKTQ